MSACLTGSRVLDLGRYIAAPQCSALLGDLGADVIRVEAPDGAPDRDVMPLTAGPGGALYLQVNRNKRSLALETDTVAGREILGRLVESSDVVVVNLPQKTLVRLGLDYESLKNFNPEIILTTISAYGFEGDDRDSIGFDGTGQSLSGASYLTGFGERPTRAAVSYVDYATGLSAAYATLGALISKLRTGQGQQVRASLLGTALSMMNPMLIEEASGSRQRTPMGNRSPIAGPSDLFATQDRWIMVQVIGDAMFERWARLIGAEDVLIDPRFTSDIARGENGEILSQRMAGWCAERTADECIETLRSARVPACLVLTPGEALLARPNAQGGFFQWQNLPGVDAPVPIVAPLARMSAADLEAPRPAPELGAHSEEILLAAGYSAAQIAAFRVERIIGCLEENGPKDHPTGGSDEDRNYEHRHGGHGSSGARHGEAGCS